VFDVDDQPRIEPLPAPSGDPPERPELTSRTVFRYAIVAALGVLLVGAAAYAAYSLANLLVQITVAAFIAVSLDPVVRWLTRHKVRRPVAVAGIFITLLGLIALVVWLAMPTLLSQASQLTSDFPGYVDKVRHRSPSLAQLELRLNLKPQVDEFAATFIDRARKQALSFGQRFLGALVSGLLVIVLTIYFMLDLPRLRRSIVRLFPLRHRPRASHAVNVVVDKVGAYMIGNLVISFIAGVTSFLALTALKIPGALPLAVFVALTDLIPLIGATLGAVVCTVVAVATTNLWPQVALLVLFFLLYQQLENYLIAPFVLRNSVDMSSVAVLLAALVGASVLGLIGALIAIPIAAAIKVIATPLLEARDVAAVVPAPDSGRGDGTASGRIDGTGSGPDPGPA
jgi:predicted PurR-regulated permease PerM